MSILEQGRSVTDLQQQKFQQRQQKFIHRTLNNYPNQSILVLTLNIPGRVQNNAVISAFFNATQSKFELGLRRIGLNLDQFQITTWQNNAGCIAFYLSKLDFTDLQLNATDFLNHYPAAALCQFKLYSLTQSTKLPTAALSLKKAEQLLKKATQPKH